MAKPPCCRDQARSCIDEGRRIKVNKGSESSGLYLNDLDNALRGIFALRGVLALRGIFALQDIFALRGIFRLAGHLILAGRASLEKSWSRLRVQRAAAMLLQ